MRVGPIKKCLPLLDMYSALLAYRARNFNSRICSRLFYKFQADEVPASTAFIPTYSMALLYEVRTTSWNTTPLSPWPKCLILPDETTCMPFIWP
jgi:hypothetical protein